MSVLCCLAGQWRIVARCVVACEAPRGTSTADVGVPNATSLRLVMMDKPELTSQYNSGGGGDTRPQSPRRSAGSGGKEAGVWLPRSRVPGCGLRQQVPEALSGCSILQAWLSAVFSGGGGVSVCVRSVGGGSREGGGGVVVTEEAVLCSGVWRSHCRARRPR